MGGFILRDNDQKGFHPQTGERQFDLLSVPLDLTAEAVTFDGDAVHIDCRGDHDRTMTARRKIYQPADSSNNPFVNQNGG
ncbi:hypothetical protein [Rhizobium leguminosarum]|uniref:hypothetical protein n=1 Tax=Rhizobium leguminosarum TaxID=384 RepID=UPI001FDEC366|nr:hypothetical protein [Rhizobium leguminosarum]